MHQGAQRAYPMPTIRQLAELAGVSHSTVSRALRNDPRISPAVRQRIKTLAEECHFRPNRLAHSALTGKSAMLGMLMTDVGLLFESNILRGVLDSAYSNGYRVIVEETAYEMPRARQAIHTLLEQRVEALLLLSIHRTPIPRSSLLEMRSHDVPFTAMDFTAVEDDIPWVGTDETRLGELAVEHLNQLGHRRIAYVGPAPDAYRGGRARAIRDALRQRCLSTAHILDWGVESCHDFSADRALEQLCRTGQSPTAIICWEDRVAAKIIRDATRQGLAVPRDLSVVGCSNTTLAEFFLPAITSVEQHPAEIGRIACRDVLRRLSAGEDEAPEACWHTPVTPSLVIRESCAPPHRR
jgi:DNA-binding LacI/PurR family transcriptional regulator